MSQSQHDQTTTPVPARQRRRGSAGRTIAQYALYGRLGAAVTHSCHDGQAITAAARAAFVDRFAREVDPDGVLPPAERERRAAHARKAYFTRLAMRRHGRGPAPKRPRLGPKGGAA